MDPCQNARCEWWIADNGENYLKGDNEDCTNPPRLPDEWIIAWLREIPEAKASFFRLLGSMLPAEQERLRGLLAGDTLIPIEPDKTHEDNFQHTLNIQGIHTAGPYGGTGFG